jgi:hypothetical protein
LAAAVWTTASTLVEPVDGAGEAIAIEDVDWEEKTPEEMN